MLSLIRFESSEPVWDPQCLIRWIQTGGQKNGEKRRKQEGMGGMAGLAFVASSRLNRPGTATRVLTY